MMPRHQTMPRTGAGHSRSRSLGSAMVHGAVDIVAAEVVPRNLSALGTPTNMAKTL